MDNWQIGDTVYSKFNPSFKGTIEQINAKGTRIIKTNWYFARYEFGNIAHMNMYWIKGELN